MGILTGHSGDPAPEPDRITFEQTPDELARIYDLPSGEVAVVVPAKMTVLRSGILITDVAMMTPWEDWPLDLWDPLEGSHYPDVIAELCHFPPTVLNPWLQRNVPLRPRQMEGVIIAHGYISVPPECHDETLIAVKLLLTDKRRDQLSFEFGVRMDRSVMRKCERRQRERCEFARTMGKGLFEPKGGQPAARKSVSPEEVIKQSRAGPGHGVTCDARTPETKLVEPEVL